VLVYVVVFTITAGTGLAGISITFVGPVHSVLTVTGISTAGLNSTAQFRITLAPAITPSGAVTVTAVGAGTEGRKITIKILRIRAKNTNLTTYFQSRVHEISLDQYYCSYNDLHESMTLKASDTALMELGRVEDEILTAQEYCPASE
jgi:hypothetical protein